MMVAIKRDRDRERHVMCQQEIFVGSHGQEKSLEYLTFPSLTQTGIVNHLFTTRIGGVSEDIFSSMNLSFSRGDEPDRVLENYRRIGKVLGCQPQDMVCSDQTHTTNIRLVTEQDKGKGLVRPKDYQNIDGLITKDPGVALVTLYADCVPLYFVDPIHSAIGLAHSGWKGTTEAMAEKLVTAMQSAFGTRPEHLLAAIGPSICQECYEVSEDVAQCFQELSNQSEAIMEELRENGCYHKKNLSILLPGKSSGKYQLDLWLANIVLLRRAGISLSNISVTDICTCHNPEYLFSHRASQGKRGNLGAFLMLKC